MVTFAKTTKCLRFKSLHDDQWELWRLHGCIEWDDKGLTVCIQDERGTINTLCDYQYHSAVLTKTIQSALVRGRIWKSFISTMTKVINLDSGECYEHVNCLRGKLPCMPLMHCNFLPTNQKKLITPTYFHVKLPTVRNVIMNCLWKKRDAAVLWNMFTAKCPSKWIKGGCINSDPICFC